MRMMMRLVVWLVVYQIVDADASSSTKVDTAGDCKETPIKTVEEECNVEEVLVNTTKLIEQCKDVFVTHCKHKILHPVRPFSTSRIVGKSSHLVASGVPVRHPFSRSKREDYITDEEKEGECYHTKEKHCFQVPEVKKTATEVCKNVTKITFVDRCESIASDTQQNDSLPFLSKTLPSVAKEEIGSSGYLRILLPFLFVSFSLIILIVWILSLWMGVSMLDAIKIISQPVLKGLGYIKFK